MLQSFIFQAHHCGCSYMPPIWLFCICSGKVSKLSILNMIFFLLKVATGWHMLLVVVNILFGVKILTEFGEEEKLNYSLPQIGG